MANLFTPPTFQEYDKNRKAQTIHKTIASSELIVSLILIAEWLALPAYGFRWLLIICIFNFFSFGLIILNKNGHFKITAYSFICCVFLLIFSLSLISGGMKATVLHYVPVVILAIGLILGWKESIIIAFISVVFCLCLVFAEYGGLLPASEINHTTFTLWLNFTCQIIILVLLQYIIVANLNKALDTAQHEIMIRKNSESRIASISNNLQDGMIYQVVIQKDGLRKFTYLSNSVQQLYGITPENGMKDASLLYGKIHPDDYKPFLEAEDESLRLFSTFKIEVRIIGPSGEIRWSSFVSTPALLEDGYICFDGVEFVITERKEREDELKKRMDELVTWQKVTIDREVRVLELKKEVNTLLQNLDMPARYENI